jgi:hypothetical protein
MTARKPKHPYQEWRDSIGLPGHMVITPEMRERMEEITREGGDVRAYLTEMIALKEAGTPPARLA